MGAGSTGAAVSFEDVSKVYTSPTGADRYALANVSLTVTEGRRAAIIGRSGSGKSTLLHLVAGIDQPTSGDVVIFGESLRGMSEKQRTRLRRDVVSLVFQFFYLQSHLTVWENVALPALIAGQPRREYAPRVDELLERVGLSDRGSESAQKLSGGEQQRIAICRALLRRPKLLLADEPTGNLDDENGRHVMELMEQMVAEAQATLLFVTHSAELAHQADEVFELKSGVLLDA